MSPSCSLVCEYRVPAYDNGLRAIEPDCRNEVGGGKPQTRPQAIRNEPDPGQHVDDTRHNSYLTMMWRAWRLRCPRCGQGWLFKNWIAMHPHCPWCELKYEREPGYFLGSIYINYGLTAMLVTISYFTLLFSKVVSAQTALWIVAAFALLFPIFFFRYARSLWLGFDHFWDPSVDEPLPRESASDEESPF
jgi:uncharacterized protein (DUF983 family)